MAEPASGFDINPLVVLIERAEPTVTLVEWFAFVNLDEPLELGVSATQSVAEAREAGKASSGATNLRK